MRRPPKVKVIPQVVAYASKGRLVDRVGPVRLRGLEADGAAAVPRVRVEAPSKAKRMTPPANRLLPFASASGAHSRTTTLAPCSRADRAAQSAALPAPTTMTSCSGLSIAPERGV